MAADDNRLILWDIDGTLITTGAAGERAIAMATTQQFGRRGDLAGVEIAGRTDTGIVHQILAKYGEPIGPGNVAEFLDLYVELLARELPRSAGRVLPGVRELLERTAQEPRITLGLLTGNLQRGAKLKLEHYGLWRFFSLGAFADDHHERNELGAFAVRRALEKTGRELLPGQVDVIGDTGHDVACGKAIGARTIAVATGGWSRERLAETAPDFLFDELADIDEVIRVLQW